MAKTTTRIIMRIQSKHGALGPYTRNDSLRKVSGKRSVVLTTLLQVGVDSCGETTELGADIALITHGLLARAVLDLGSTDMAVAQRFQSTVASRPRHSLGGKEHFSQRGHGGMRGNLCFALC